MPACAYDSFYRFVRICVLAIAYAGSRFERIAQTKFDDAWYLTTGTYMSVIRSISLTELNSVPKKRTAQFDEKKLTKGQLRKLNALRKSLGKDIADKAFSEWLETSGAARGAVEDKSAAALAKALAPLIKSKKLKIPRGGYLVTRWRDQVIVKPAAAKK